MNDVVNDVVRVNLNKESSEILDSSDKKKSEVITEKIKEIAIILFGPPGAGKGTFSQFVSQNWGYVHLSVGDIVRKEIDQETDIGKEAKESLSQGGLLKEVTIQSLVLKHITPLIANNKPFILDGFPRTEEAVYFIKDLFYKKGLAKNTLLIMLKAGDETCQKRIFSRMVCKGCGHVYNLVTSPPKQENKCDICIEPIRLRFNDTKDIVAKRLEEFHSITEKAYEIAKTFFSSVEFNTELPLKECLNHYDRIVHASEQ